MGFFKRRTRPGAFLHIAVLFIFTVLLAFSILASQPYFPAVQGRLSQSLDGYSGMPHGLSQQTGPVSEGYSVSFLNDRARDITGVAAVNAPGFVVPEGLTGEGQIVAIADSGLDIGRTDDIHPDLRSTPGKMPKVVLLKSWAGRDVPDDPDGHGTHMAATIAGTGAASSGKFRGIAPGASVYFQAILNKEGRTELPADLKELFWPAYSAGARVHVNGWGGGPNVYLNSSAQVDELVRKYPDLLVVFGAGNGGPGNRTITAEANSKNALVVGASVLPRPAFVSGENSTSSTAEFSSRGPAGDGRVKPELLAPASAVVSARSRLVEGNLPGYPAYTRMHGTSMASAVAGGASAILREYLQKYFNKSTPSAALVKASLINGARTEGHWPSREGFGVLDLAGTVIALQEKTFRLADEWAGVSQGDEVEYTFKVTDPAAPFKATLAWTDPPDEPGSTQALVNDLDLVVQAPDGRVYYGNHFMNQNSPDRINNVEQVNLTSLVPGDYRIRVIGSSLRLNTVRGSTEARQDFALVWGQSPARGVVAAAEGKKVVLSDGTSLSQGEVQLVNLVNDGVAAADANHFFPGAAVFRTSQKAYLAARVWRAAAVKVFKSGEGFVFTEMNPSLRLGGYLLAAEAAGGVKLNSHNSEPERLIPGLEVKAVINPYDQKIRQVQAAYLEREGVVSSISNEKGQKKLILAGGQGVYRVSGEAVYTYEDSYAPGSEAADLFFGTGALDELEELMPGMPVRLHLSPTTGEVQYLAVERQVVLGTVRETEPASGGIRLENGSFYRLFPGAPVKKDRKVSEVSSIIPGDHVTAVLLRDTGEILGLVAHSSVLHGRAIDFSKKTRTLYLQDDDGRYISLHLPPDAVIYRWGVRATADAIAAGNWIRVTTDSAGRMVWRLDIADTFKKRDIFTGFGEDKGVLNTGEGGEYRVTASSRLYKNGYPVRPEDLRPDEMLELEYAVLPGAGGEALVTVNAHNSSLPPVLLVSAVPLGDRLAVTGRTGSNATVYLRRQGGTDEKVSVDKTGRFSFVLHLEDDEEGYDFNLVAVDRRTGGIAGRQILAAGGGRRGKYNEFVSGAFSGVLTGAGKDPLPGRTAGYPPDVPLTRAEAAAVLAQLLSWAKSSEQPLPFKDAADIPAVFRTALAEARARDIFKGYPDGRLLPNSALSRAEAAVVLASLMRDLGLWAEAAPAPFYVDTAEIPPWARQSVAGTAAAKLWGDRRDGLFAPNELITAREMAMALSRLLELAETRYAEN